MARHKAPPGAVLLKRLKGMEGKPSQGLSLMLVSLSALPSEEEDEFWGQLDEFLVEFKARYEGELYELSLVDRAILVKMSETAEVGMISDIKVSVLRLVQQLYPEHFGMIDQARMLRTINLGFKLGPAIKFLEHFESQPGKTGEKGMKIRPLQEEDIKMVLEVNRKVGPEQFKKIFVQHQAMADIKPDHAPKELMNEYFIRMDALKKHVFPNVEMRGSGNLFNQLTITLDRVLIGAFDQINPVRKACSINLNVESVFTKAFETFLGKGDEPSVANMVFEFRQDNILQQFDEFKIAADLIKSRGGLIAVDAIFPETVGLVNLNKMGATFAKIFWRPGAEESLPAQREEIQRMQADGLIFILARLDDETGIQVGQDLGITVFQGFCIDDLLNTPEPEILVS
ncbi:MAG: hypothetical protein H8E39_04575 [Alphaproteobacteria bacterium]|nr:hypothetical protein [Alphaproteobacteria bacterium]